MDRNVSKKVTRLTPFEELPNLPKAKITSIDLGIRRRDISELRPSLTDKKLCGYFLSDEATQTEESNIVELKSISGTVGSLVLDVKQVREDLTTAQHLMKKDYEQRISQRAEELYCKANLRVKELEKAHAEKIETVRKSYRSQLSNAIAKIAGEYQAYYNEIMKGKTGRHDARIKELKLKVEGLEASLIESEAEILKLKDAVEYASRNMDQKQLKGLQSFFKFSISHIYAQTDTHATASRRTSLCPDDHALSQFHTLSQCRSRQSSIPNSPLRRPSDSYYRHTHHGRRFSQLPWSSQRSRCPSLTPDLTRLYSDQRPPPTPQTVVSHHSSRNSSINMSPLQRLEPLQEDTVQGPEVSSLTKEQEHELRMSVVHMEGEIEQAQLMLAEKDDAIYKLKRHSEQIERQLEDEKGKLQQLRVDMDGLKQSHKKEREKAARLAEGQREAMEREYSERMLQAEQAVLKKASQEAELQRMKDVAKFQEELEKKKSIEEELRREAAATVQPKTVAIPEGELAEELDMWKKKSLKQETQITSLRKELDRSNRVWETKLTILQKNFHALKDESYVRQHFQRQSAVLHYATVGYATGNPPLPPPPAHHIRPQHHVLRAEPVRGSKNQEKMVSDGHIGFAPPVPTPTPTHAYHNSICDESAASPRPYDRPRSVQFDRRLDHQLQTPA